MEQRHGRGRATDRGAVTEIAAIVAAQHVTWSVDARRS
jgi:hypothetical protein